MDKLTVSDADIQTEYNSKYGAPTKEYKASHILVKTEDEANALIAKLKKGADFADLAKKSSTDPGSGKNGGDLGWFPGTQMVPEFTAALQTLEKGKITDKPVKSQFGYHIIKLEDTREAAPPALAEVKPQIENTLKQQKFQKYLEDLRANAKVEFKSESSSSSSSSSVSSAAK
jgi:peptidyl-prolyl cis-trans isomerase C